MIAQEVGIEENCLNLTILYLNTVRAFGVIGGGAALAFLGATAGQALLQAGVLGGLGIAGTQTRNDIDSSLC